MKIPLLTSLEPRHLLSFNGVWKATSGAGLMSDANNWKCGTSTCLAAPNPTDTDVIMSFGTDSSITGPLINPSVDNGYFFTQIKLGPSGFTNGEVTFKNAASSASFYANTIADSAQINVLAKARATFEVPVVPNPDSLVINLPLKGAVTLHFASADTGPAWAKLITIRNWISKLTPVFFGSDETGLLPVQQASIEWANVHNFNIDPIDSVGGALIDETGKIRPYYSNSTTTQGTYGVVGGNTVTCSFSSPFWCCTIYNAQNQALSASNCGLELPTNRLAQPPEVRAEFLA
jgi:hypothetical protein